MPSGYTLETLPSPNNPQVQLLQIPAKKMAVIRFSWWAGADRFNKVADTLLESLKRDGVRTIGTPIFAGYNPPFSASWMHRNEVMVEIMTDK
jgi:effector-binding domain-containing protein